MSDFAHQLDDGFDGPQKRNRRASPASFAGLQGLVGNAAVARMVQRTAPSAPVAALGLAPRPALMRSPDGHGSSVIMRYQAGSAGHGGIEEQALGAGGAGFSASDVKAIYFGNWLRDFSQLPKHPKVLAIIDIIAGGEFGASVTEADLGTYVPSEHMDNPEGGGTLEDPAVRADPVKYAEALAKLSPAQRAEYETEEANRKNIAAAAAKSGLPVYIETAKFHSKQKLAEAVSKGHVPEGMRAMGDALHGIEDYFSHSNFTEACIFKLRADPAMKPLVDKMTETHLGPNMAMLVPTDGKGKVEIQSGTYANGANDWVSRIEALQTEATNGEMRQAFAEGFIRKQGITGEELGRRLGERVGGGAGRIAGSVAGGVSGGLDGAASGAARGAASGWSRGSGVWGTAVAMAEDIGSDAVADGVAGADAGARSTGASWEASGAAAAGGFGSLAGKSVAEIIAKVGIDAVLAVVDVPFAALFQAAKAGVLEWAAEHETDASGGEARRKGLKGPTHSELSKDGPKNPLFGASTTLAKHADKEIGTAMQAAWAASGSGGAPTGAAQGPPTAAQAAATKSVTDLVDKFVAHPDASSWWEPIIKSAAAASGP